MKFIEDIACGLFGENEGWFNFSNVTSLQLDFTEDSYPCLNLSHGEQTKSIILEEESFKDIEENPEARRVMLATLMLCVSNHFDKSDLLGFDRLFDFYESAKKDALQVIESSKKEAATS